MRLLRRALTSSQKRSAALSFARIASSSLLLRPGSHIAVYHAYRDEADLSALITLARSRGCELYLPRITQQRSYRMQFFRFNTRVALRPNLYGILEPAISSSAPVRLRNLDLIFMPLVAFDDAGWRLGSGAGFYDRCLQHLRTDRCWRRPKLIGVAYEFQRVARLGTHPWDVPMDAVLTERGLRHVSTNRGFTT